MKVLLLGANGQVGHELRRALAPLGTLSAHTRATADLADFDRLRDVLRRESADVIVNAAAYTAVDKAESEPDLADRINAAAAGVMAEEARRADAWLVHYSTDYVFDGAKTSPYGETDAPHPLSAYGASKLKGEQAIAATGCRHLIFRTGWVYGLHGHNFPKTILKLAKERDELSVVADQTGAPTAAELIAEITAAALGQIAAGNAATPAGVYHLTAAGETTWYAFARYILEKAQAHGHALKATADRVKPIAAAAYPAKARRPANSRLATGKLTATFNLTLPPWEHHAGRFVTALPKEDR